MSTYLDTLSIGTSVKIKDLNRCLSEGILFSNTNYDKYSFSNVMHDTSFRLGMLRKLGELVTITYKSIGKNVFRDDLWAWPGECIERGTNLKIKIL